MKRNALYPLQAWLENPARKPLVIRGARQVGKSTLVREFCREHQLSLVEINLEKNKIDHVFSELNIEKIIREIESITRKSLRDPGAVLFLDEIQAVPSAIEALRYFYEERPSLPVVAAGSLLEFVLNREKLSIPVGRIQYLFLGPMAFDEFLLAKHEDLLLKSSNDPRRAQNDHKRLTDLFKEFLFVGGMPEAVKVWCETNDIKKVQEVHASILNTYCDDFDKYDSQRGHLRLNKVWNWIPSEIGKKVKYVNISREHQARELKNALDLLIAARVVIPVYHTSASGLPLRAQADESCYKLYFLDVGLLCAALGIGYGSIANYDEEALVNKGQLAEQFVAQHLYYLNDSLFPPELFYWVRDKKNSSAEIDFLMTRNGMILPVEVKSGAIGRFRSLDVFMDEKKLSQAIVLNMNKEDEIKEKGRSIRTFPLYQLPGCLKE
jgi:predicted AAA+ superfamily ATPase